MGKHLAIYLRLSVEDERDIEKDLKKDESNSIGNQRKLILEYIQQDSELCKYEISEFMDDGYSGTNMNRPGMKKLLKEVKTNTISCILVKDMSRFSRDYIEMGTYLNQIFPFMGVRFIAVNDHYDSREHNGSTIAIDTAFQTLLYDLYSKDVSVKVKTAFENKCANGEYVFGQAPFGYEKSKEVKNTVIVNEKEAQIVRHIFSLAMQGKSSTQIARQLYEEGVPTIPQFRRPNQKMADGKIHTWGSQAVRNILNNRFYLGEMAYGKSVRKLVGSKNGLAVPKDDWKVIPNHHEALISEEVFEQVSCFSPELSAKCRDSIRENRDKHPLMGKVHCGGCGYCMSYRTLRGKNRYRRFECRKHAMLKIPECCTYMRADRLEEIVLLMLRKELMLRGDAVRQKERVTLFQQAGIRALQKKLKEYEQEKRRVQAEQDGLYERYALGEIGIGEYRERAEELEKRLGVLVGKAEEDAGKLSVLEKEWREMEEDMEQVVRYVHMEELTREVVEVFVRRVWVYRDKRVEVEWGVIKDR